MNINNTYFTTVGQNYHKDYITLSKNKKYLYALQYNPDDTIGFGIVNPRIDIYSTENPENENYHL